MTGEAEAGDVRAGTNAELREDFGRRLVRDQHLFDGLVEVRGRAFAAHPGGHDGSRTDRFCQDQYIARGEIAFAKELILIRVARHRKAE